MGIKLYALIDFFLFHLRPLQRAKVGKALIATPIDTNNLIITVWIDVGREENEDNQSQQNKEHRHRQFIFFKILDAVFQKSGCGTHHFLLGFVFFGSRLKNRQIRLQAQDTLAQKLFSLEAGAFVLLRGRAFNLGCHFIFCHRNVPL